MPPAAESSRANPATPARIHAWRAVEGQHLVSTMRLVDTRAEQELLERILESSKPPIPEETHGLHYLLATPFRYPPNDRGSRFRRTIDPGVFYGAEAIRTACAELGYWRWRFLIDSPALERLDPAPHTIFRVVLKGMAIDLRDEPFKKRWKSWTDPIEYGPCQRLADRARGWDVALIRYESVRDPEHGGAVAVLHPRAFSHKSPLASETWYLGVTQARIQWWRDASLGTDPGYEFNPTVFALPPFDRDSGDPRSK